jgi:hypothetical protein
MVGVVSVIVIIPTSLVPSFTTKSIEDESSIEIF